MNKILEVMIKSIFSTNKFKKYQISVKYFGVNLQINLKDMTNTSHVTIGITTGLLYQKTVHLFVTIS